MKTATTIAMKRSQPSLPRFAVKPHTPLISNLLAVAASLLAASFIGTAKAADDWPILLKEDFEQGADRWTPTDAKAWKIVDANGGHAYSLFQQSKYEPPHRSPFNFSLARDLIVGDFSLEARVRSTVKDYPHRDICLVFGYQDPAHFYYVHLGKQTDDHANQIFIVNGAPRTKISTSTTAGTNWDDEWHKITLVRSVSRGTIEVFWDDLERPIMTAQDKTFTWGQIGLGSFDDTGDFDDVVVRGVRVEKP